MGSSISSEIKKCEGKIILHKSVLSGTIKGFTELDEVDKPPFQEASAYLLPLEEARLKRLIAQNKVRSKEITTYFKLGAIIVSGLLVACVFG